MATPLNIFTEFQATLGTSRHILAIAGAGLSAASGIPTFRGAGGLWRKYDAMTLATPESFYENPSLVWQFYHYRRETALKAHPNAAHDAMAAFSLPWIRDTAAPGSTFTLITQNVDGLSVRALETAEALHTVPEGYSSTDKQPRLLEMHGRLFDILCSSESCEHVEFDTTSPVCEALGGTETLVIEGTLKDPDIPIESLPRCSKCGSLARPGVVWFGETPQYLKTIDKLVKRADLCIVVGTSSTVYPAAGYAEKIKRRGGKVAVFNLERSAGDEMADYLFLGPCEETLPKALGIKA